MNLPLLQRIFEIGWSDPYLAISYREFKNASRYGPFPVRFEWESLLIFEAGKQEECIQIIIENTVAQLE